MNSYYPLNLVLCTIPLTYLPKWNSISYFFEWLRLRSSYNINLCKYFLTISQPSKKIFWSRYNYFSSISESNNYTFSFFHHTNIWSWHLLLLKATSIFCGDLHIQTHKTDIYVQYFQNSSNYFYVQLLQTR